MVLKLQLTVDISTMILYNTVNYNSI